MSANPETDVLSIFVGFFVLVLILGELHGFSATSAIFALPLIILSGLVLFVSYTISIILGAAIGAAGAGALGALILLIVAFWVFKSLAGVTAQNYIVFAILLVALLLVL